MADAINHQLPMADELADALASLDAAGLVAVAGDDPYVLYAWSRVPDSATGLRERQRNFERADCADSIRLDVCLPTRARGWVAMTLAPSVCIRAASGKAASTITSAAASPR